MKTLRTLLTEDSESAGDGPDRDRGISMQIDLLIMAVLVLASFTVFITFGLGLVEDIRALSPGDEANVDRNIEIVANDYLVADANDATLDSGCTEDFFSKSPSPGCGHDTSWGSDSYLFDALYLESNSTHIEIQDSSGSTATLPSGTDLEVGDSLDTMDEDAIQQSMYVSLDVDGDGSDELLRLTMTVW
jgi:hypothetical protein